MPATIRPLDAKRDCGRIAALMRDYGFPRVTADGLREYFMPKPDQTRRTLVAVRSGRDTAEATRLQPDPLGGGVIGYVDVHRQRAMPTGKFLMFLLVDPVDRRQGIGTRLYSEATSFAAEHTLPPTSAPTPRLASSSPPTPPAASGSASPTSASTRTRATPARA